MMAAALRRDRGHRVKALWGKTRLLVALIMLAPESSTVVVGYDDYVGGCSHNYQRLHKN